MEFKWPRKILLKFFFFFALALFFLNCNDDAPTAPYVAEPYLIVDSSYLIETPFTTAACNEIIPMNASIADHIPPGTVAKLTVITTACYHVRVKVVSPAPDTQTIRTFDQYFSIIGRKDGDKNRGVASYLTWDGLDDSGKVAPKLRYLWRLHFDLGGGNYYDARADIIL